MGLIAMIPSKGRPYTIGKETLSWLPKVGIDYRVVVEPHEERHYKLTCGNRNLLVLDKSDMGIGYAVRFYSEWAKYNGYNFIFRFDDDIKNWKSKKVSSDKSEQIVKHVIEQCKDEFLDDKLGAIRFIGSRYYIYESIGLDRKFTHRNDELWGTSIIRTDLSCLMNPALKTFDDTYLTLKIWEAGYDILTYGWAGLTVGMDTNQGGLQVFDRKAISIESFNLIKKEFPKVESTPNANNRIDLNVKMYGNKTVLH